MSLRPLSLHLPSRPRKRGTSLVTRRWRVIPSDGSPCGGGSTEEHEVASLGIRVRFPAAAPVECSRDYIGNASKEARRFEPSRERKLSKSLRPLSTSIDSSECRRSYFFEKDELRHLLSLRFSAVNAQGTTWTLRVAG